MKIRKYLLPAFIIVVFPIFNITNYVILARSFKVTGILFSDLFFSWLSSALFVLMIWVFNDWLIKKRYFLQTLRSSPIKFLAAALFNFLLLVPLAFSIKKFGLMQNPGLLIVPTWLLVFKLYVLTMVIVTMQTAIAFSNEAQQIKLSNAELRNENLEARLAVLKQQMNPHFLFNALTTLQSMVREKNTNSEEFIQKLSGIYRQLLKAQDADTILLSDECLFLQDYVFMLRERFEDMLHINIHILPECNTAKIPSLSLQLLVENAVKHNAISRAKPLTIDVYQQNKHTITVDNNLQPLSHPVESSGIGLTNLGKRYQLLQIQNGIIIEKSNTLFRVNLKLIPNTLG